MASTIQHANVTSLATALPEIRNSAKYREVFDHNHHRVYALSFWMTDSELAAEDLMHNSFCRAFSKSSDPDAEAIDRALIAELQELGPLGSLVLEEPSCQE